MTRLLWRGADWVLWYAFHACRRVSRLLYEAWWQAAVRGDDEPAAAPPLSPPADRRHRRPGGAS